MTLNAMKIELNIENFGVATAWRMLKYLGFKYEPRKKTYYNDRHESIENESDRKRFVLRYLELELRSRVWV